MFSKNLFLKLSIVVAITGLAFASTLPGVMADTALLPTLRATVSGGGGGTGGAATLSAAATTASAASTKVAATAAAVATKAAGVKATLTPFATTGSEAATQAITSYASSVLGINVTVKKAGGLTGDVTKTITQMPSGATAQSAVTKLAVTTYGAILSNGGASLSYGKGTVTGDVTIDVQGSSLGVYSLVVSNTGALDANSALTLAKNTFPGVAGYTFTPQTVSKGFAWYAKGTDQGYDLKTKKVTVLAEAVILYVLPSTGGKATVTATVGRGDFAAMVKP